jgi:[acyl-carrier-protein] S-malonyltransferase
LKNLNSDLAMKVAAVFSGGGSQYLGMGKDLYNAHSIAKNTFDEADDLLGFKLSQICFEGSMDKLSKMEIAQPAIYVLSTALFRVFNNAYGFKTDFFAGHSLGEYTALTAAGVLEFADGVKLVYERGKLLQHAGGQGQVGMLAVNKLSLRQIEYAICKIDKENLFVAVLNSEYQFVISGYKHHFKKLKELLESCGGNVEILNINTASHCPIMKDAMKSFADVLDKIKFGTYNTPVISNVTALPYSDNDQLNKKLAVHMVVPVLWSDSMNYLFRQGVNTIVEIGPNVILKNLTRFVNKDVQAYSLDEKADWNLLRQKCNKYTKAIQHCLSIAVSTKNHNNSCEDYQLNVISRYGKLREIREKLDHGDPKPEDAQSAIKLVSEILRAKRIPAIEIRELMSHPEKLLTGLPTF